MTFFHFHARVHQRSKGQSAVAAAAYRAGAQLTDKRTGVCHDYGARWVAGSVTEREILHPVGATWAADRSVLWNLAEATEVKRNACVAREYEAAIPADLPRRRMIAMVREFAQLLVDRFRVVVDWVLHRPRRGSQNWHAHFLTTTRVANEAGLAQKTRELDDRRAGSNEIKRLRAAWAFLCNRELHAVESPLRVDHRSYLEQGVEKVAQRHMAKAAAALERRGTPTRIGDYNRHVRTVNRLRVEAEAARDEAARDRVLHEQAIRQVEAASVHLPRHRLPMASPTHSTSIDDVLGSFVAAARQRGKAQGGLTDALLAQMVAEMAAKMIPRVAQDHPPAPAASSTDWIRRKEGRPSVGTTAMGGQRKTRPAVRPEAAAMWLDLDGVASLLRRRRRRAKAARGRDKQQAAETVDIAAVRVTQAPAEAPEEDAVPWMTEYLAELADRTAPALRRFRKSIAQNAAAAIRASASGSSKAGRTALKAMVELLAPEPVEQALDQVPPHERIYIDQVTGRRYRLSGPLTNEQVIEIRRQYPGTSATRGGEGEIGLSKAADEIVSWPEKRSAGDDPLKLTDPNQQKRRRPIGRNGPNDSSMEP